MLHRRLLIGGGLSLAVGSSQIVPAQAQTAKITLAFVGHEL